MLMASVLLVAACAAAAPAQLPALELGELHEAQLLCAVQLGELQLPGYVPRRVRTVRCADSARSGADYRCREVREQLLLLDESRQPTSITVPVGCVPVRRPHGSGAHDLPHGPHY